MKEEFANDPMMWEIHQIREKNYLKTKALSYKERMQCLEENVEKFLSSHGYKFIPTDHGTQRLVKVA